MTHPIQELHKSDNLLANEIDGEVVILNLDTEVYFALEGVGRRIWQLMDETPSLSAILDRLENEYEVERAQLQADVESFAAVLAAKGLIRTDPSPA